MIKDHETSRKIDNGVVPSKADLQASGSWSLPFFGLALVTTILVIGTMLGSGDASAFFGK
ncbi:hypothetical protein [Nisaea sp.]|uniref:hypothetical protein n=1 Tax=Nisaea sp. TaxID=2024842 RepID=UPI003B51CC3A